MIQIPIMDLLVGMVAIFAAFLAGVLARIVWDKSTSRTQ